MPHIVPVLLVELIISLLVEGLTPENETLFQVQTDALEEQRVLEAAEVLQVSVAAERAVKMRHAGWEMLGQVVNVGSCDLGSRGCCGIGGVGRVGGNEVLGQVIKDGSQTVVFVQAWKSAGGQLFRSAMIQAPSKRALTSSCLSRRDVNSATTMLDCSLPGTYALP